MHLVSCLHRAQPHYGKNSKQVKQCFYEGSLPIPIIYEHDWDKCTYYLQSVNHVRRPLTLYDTQKPLRNIKAKKHVELPEP